MITESERKTKKFQADCRQAIETTIDAELAFQEYCVAVMTKEKETLPVLGEEVPERANEPSLDDAVGV